MKTGLNAPFYKWIDDVKKAIRHKRELEEKLEYYESRLTGYQAVVYDSIGSSSSRNNVEENLLYVIGKIDQVKMKIENVERIIKGYFDFKLTLKEQESTLLEHLVETTLSKTEISVRISISRTRIYKLIDAVIRTKKNQ